MFNYHNYSSTKRNQFKIGRGALGHGLKTVLGSAYALATEHYGYSNWTPLKIRNGNKQWTISLILDRITGLHPPDIKSIIVNDILKTEIEIDIPVDSDSVDKNVSELTQTFYKYLILNPHITMNLTIWVLGVITTLKFRKLNLTGRIYIVYGVTQKKILSILFLP